MTLLLKRCRKGENRENPLGGNGGSPQKIKVPSYNYNSGLTIKM